MTPTDPTAAEAPGPEGWTDAAPIAKYLGCAESGVLRMALAGDIPHLVLPSRGRKRQHYRFRLSDVIAWAERRANPGRRK
jgi:hypothetical protein